MEKSGGRALVRVMVALVGAAAALLTAVPGAAAGQNGAPMTFVVDRADDPGLPTDCATPAVDQDCSLRSAAQLANAHAGVDLIQIAVSGPITLTTDEGALNVTSPVDIAPLDPAAVVTVDGQQNPPARVFAFSGSGSSVLERLVVTGGDAIVANPRADFAGFANTGDGGGIHVRGEVTLTLDQVTVTGNTATFEGGGVFVDGAQLNVQDSTFSGNDAELGGGLALRDASGEISTSTVTGNTAQNGGGLAVITSAVTVRNSTIHDNGATSRGGGIFAAADGPGQLNIEHVTLTDNTAFTGGQQSPPEGQNIHVQTTVNSQAFNRGVTSSEGGGNTFAGGGPFCSGARTDQRGVGRPDDAGTGTTLCDRGAFESEMLIPRGGPPPVTPRADLAVDKTGPAQVTAGEDVTWTVVTANAGPSSAVSAELVDTLPAGVTFVSASPGCVHAAGVVTCALGTLASGASASTTIVATTSAVGSLTNAAEAESATNDPDLANNADEHLTDVVDVTRCAGLTRIITAIECSIAVFASAPDVVLTRADLFPDAQAGTPLAVDLGAPLLLSEPGALNPDTEEEILRVLEPNGRVHLLGGTEALSQAVEDRLTELDIATVRYPGANRFGTAVLIAEGLGNPGVALATDGGDFPDSVIAGAAAVVAGADFAQAQPAIAAVLLTSGADVPPETAAYLEEHDPQLFAVGGGAAAALPGAEALIGDDRFRTAVVVAERFFPSPAAAGLATGLDFADALVGGAIVGTPAIGPGPMLLTEPDALPDVVADYLADHADTLDNVLIFGGTAAVSQDVEDTVAAILAEG